MKHIFNEPSFWNLTMTFSLHWNVFVYVRPIHKPRTDQDFQSQAFFWLRPHISSPCRRVGTTGKSERLIDGASTSFCIHVTEYTSNEKSRLQYSLQYTTTYYNCVPFSSIAYYYILYIFIIRRIVMQATTSLWSSLLVLISNFLLSTKQYTCTLYMMHCLLSTERLHGRSPCIVGNTMHCG